MLHADVAKKTGFFVMSLYRMHGDDKNFHNFVVPGGEVIKKLGGRDYPFHIDRAPKSYHHVWVQPLEIVFYDGKQGKEKSIPDIIENNGRLYVNNKAYSVLHELFASYGEFLPVYHHDGEGYIFNPLKTAEEADGIDAGLVAYDKHGNLVHFGFCKEKLVGIPLFRTAIDTYLGIFCSTAVKEVVEKAGVYGVVFGSDISNPIGVGHGTTH